MEDSFARKTSEPSNASVQVTSPSPISSRFKIPTLELGAEAALPLTPELRENLMNIRRDVIAFLRRLDEMLGLEQTIPRRKR